jgi:16S rRNA (cytidine1402-2'-O)-methyltransferase
MPHPGTLYLIPVPLGNSPLETVLPEHTRRMASGLDTFIVENAKTARLILKQIGTATPLQELTLMALNEHTRANELGALLLPLLAGKNVGLLSEAGCPAVADPGADLVRLAHQRGLRVVPLAGPSSLLLALMASGLGGQRFAFHGYLPVEKAARGQKLRELERLSRQQDQTQMFIEAPYRNDKLLADMMEILEPETLLCVACDLTLPTEQVATRPVSGWKGKLPELDRRPTVFLIKSMKV